MGELSKMKRTILIVFAVIAILNFGFTLKDNKKNTAAAADKTEVMPNIIIVKMKENIQSRLNKNDAEALRFNKLLTDYNTYSFIKMFPAKQELAKTTSDNVDLSKLYYVRYSDNADPYEVANAFMQSSLVEYAEPKFIRHTCYSPNDPYYVANSQWAIKKIQADLAWDLCKGSSEVVIGIVDTGVDWTHQDIYPNIWINKKEINGNGIDDDNNGYVDDIRGWDLGGQGNGSVPTPDNDPNEDQADHGTHVAGIASASTDNSVGMAGIGFNCKLMCVKVAQNNQRTAGGAALIVYGFEGIVYAADNGANIINCSWGGGGYSKSEDDIIHYATKKGALVVAAAGNDGLERNDFFPAGYDQVLSVASVDVNDVKASSSNYGVTVDVSAPGVNILSTWKDNKYVNLNGTSMATPCAAGVAALVKSYYPNYTPDQIRERVRLTADKIDNLNPYIEGKIGYGRVNAYRALTVKTPAVKVSSYSLDDKTYGNGNGVCEPGEKIKLLVLFKNYLDEASNVTVKLVSGSAYTKISKESISIPSLATLQEYDNSSNAFEFIVDPATPANTTVSLYLTITAGSINDQQTISFIINPSFASTKISKIKTTFTSMGNIGFNDYSSNLQGDGFVYNSDNVNLLFEGALMIGTSATQVSDAARSAVHARKQSFKTITPLKFNYSGFSDEDIETSFSDDNSTNKIGVTTTLKSYAFKKDPYNNFILMKYNFKNTNQISLDKLYTGLFFDWDLSSGGSKDVVRYDANSSMAYIRSTEAVPTTKAYVGIAVLNPVDKVNCWPILNSNVATDPYWGIYDGFIDEEKFQSLSSGIKRDSVGPGDIGLVIGAGPLAIAAGASKDVVIALVAGYSLQELRQAVAYATEKYNATVGVSQASELLPLTYSVSQNYPNPFNPSTNINFVLKEKGAIHIQVYDINGSLVKDIYKDNLSSGDGNITLDMKSCATGVYYYKFSALNGSKEIAFTKNGKFILLK